jgi:hypothetical protein
MKRIIPIILLVSLAAACNGTVSNNGPLPTNPDDTVSNEPGDTPIPTTEPFAPQPGDAKFLRGNVFIDSVNLLTLESYPPQFVLNLVGGLPTPCNQLRLLVHSPDEQNRIKVEAYSVLDPGVVCIQVLKDFDVNLSLGTYPQGKYSIWINDQQVKEFEW